MGFVVNSGRDAQTTNMLSVFLKNLKEYHGGCVKVLFGFWFVSGNERFTARQVNCSTGVHYVKYRL